MIKENSNLKPIVFKQYNNGFYKLFCQLRDENNESFINRNDVELIFKAKEIDQDLKNAFGDKDLIRLK